MTSEERNDRIMQCLASFHTDRAIPLACEACDLLYEELTSQDEEGEEKNEQED